MKKDSLGIETLCVHAGIGDFEYGPVNPPIYQTSTFRFRDAKHGAALFAGQEKGYSYTRMSNPTVEALENAVAELEGGYKALGCASGMAAVHTALASSLAAGDHVICTSSCYGATSGLLSGIFPNYGVTVSFVDTSDLNEVIAAFRPETKIVYIETPGNPTMSISDIQEISSIAHQHGAKVIVDNTFLSPILQQPLKLGADIVLHSMTKYLNGHSDVIAGIVVVKDEETYKKFRKMLNHFGGVIDPFNSFLVHRGIKTLYMRMQCHCYNAQKIAEFLESHPLVKSVSYPGLKSHPQYELARRQQKGPGGMVTIELKGGIKAGETFINNVKIFQLAVSLGGVESLVQHPASMTHAAMGRETRIAAGITDGLVRISVGCENADDLICDLEQALAKVK
jgi:methionine-gamma-lyase